MFDNPLHECNCKEFSMSLPNDPQTAHDECCHDAGLDRRQFLKASGAAAVVAASLPQVLSAKDKKAKATPESHVQALYKALTPEQRSKVCFDWEHQHGQRGLLRTRVENNWHITDQAINSKFFTDEQRDIIRSIFTGLYSPEWVPRIDKQLKDDSGGYGRNQNIAIFGKPGSKKFEFVMTGRHLTIRCDGNSADHVAFAGPIFYGHAAGGGTEKKDHPGNVFWPQAIQANKVYAMLDGKQRKKALLRRAPREQAVAFRGKEKKIPGIAVKDLSEDQKAEVQKTLGTLIAMYRNADQQEALKCLKVQGGLDACSMAFYQSGDIGDDGVWDNWRLEGPSFVWHFRGAPHVHVWVNLADSASVKLNA